MHRMALRAKLQAATLTFIAQRGEAQEDGGGSFAATLRRVAVHFCNETKWAPGW